jgi:hypothetical protein
VTEKIATTPIRGRCPVCTGDFTVTKAGVMRWHCGDYWNGRFRLMCAGVGQPPQPVWEHPSGYDGGPDSG